MDHSKHNPPRTLATDAMMSDPETFADMVRQYYGPIYFTSLSIARDKEIAQDIVQETFLRAWLKRDEMQQPVAQLLPWLARIARNLAIQWQRQGQRRSRLLPVLSLEEIMVDPADPNQPHPRDAAAQTEQTFQVGDAVMNLPEDLRQVVLLHYGEGLSAADIARLTGEARSTVTRRLTRAHKKLRFHLEDGVAIGLAMLKPPRVHLEHTCAIAGAVAMLPATGRAQLLRGIADTPLPPLADTVIPGPHSGAGKTANPFTAFITGLPAVKSILLGTGIILGLGAYAVFENAPQKVLASFQNTPAAAVTMTTASPNQKSKPENSTRTYTKQYRRSTRNESGKTNVRRTPAEYGPLPPANQKVEIRGKVLDPAGNPVAGAKVEPAGAYRSSPRTPSKVITSAGGSFHINGVSPGNMSLVVRALGYAPIAMQVTAPDDNIVVQLQGRGARLAGRVINNETGQPVKQSTVTLEMTISSLPTDSPELVTNADGSFTFENLAPGEYILSAKAHGLAMQPEKRGWFSKSRLPFKTYTLAEGDSVNDITVHMHGGHTVTGLVTEAGTGKPISEVKIEQLNFDGRPIGASARTDAAGHYRLDHVAGAAVNRVWLKLTSPGYIHSPESQYGHPNSPMFDLPQEREVIQNFTLDAAVRITGTVQDESGQPVAPAYLTVHDMLGNSRFITDAAGRYDIFVLPDRNIIMEVVAPGGYTRQEVLIEATDQPANYEVILQRGITAGGVVLTGAGQPVEGMTVEARTLPPRVENQGAVTSYGSEKTVAATITDKNGRFALSNLPRNNIVLVASGNNYAPSRAAVEVPRDGVDIVDKAVIEIDGGAEIHGVIKAPNGSPVSDAEVQLYGLGDTEDALNTKSNADGVFTFTSLAPKRVSLMISHPEYGELMMNEVIPGDNQLELIYGGPGSMKDYLVSIIDGNTGDPIRNYEVLESLGESPVKQDNGTFIQRLVAGKNTDYTIHAEGYALLHLKDFPVPDYQSSPTFTLAMGPGATIRGELAWPGETTASLAGISVKAGPANQRKYDISSSTDSSGRFELHQVPAGTTEVRIQPPPPFRSTTRNVEAIHGKTVDLGRIELEPGIRVQGHLRGTNGVGIAAVEVEISELNQSPRKAITDAYGFYMFDGMGHRDYWMNIPQFGLAAHLRLMNQQGANAPARVITQDFHLGTGMIRGRVQHNGVPVSGVSITLIHDNASRWKAKSGRDGGFTLEQVAAGEFLLLAHGLGNHSGRSVVRLADGETTTVVIALDSGRIRGKVLDLQDNPMPGLTLTLTNQHIEPRLRAAYGVMSGLDGTFNLGVPAGKYAVVGTLDERIMTSVYNAEVPPGGVSEELQIRVTEKTGSIISVTRKSDGAPRLDVKTQITVKDAGAYHHLDQDRDTNGVLTVNDLPPGNYKLWLSADNAEPIVHNVEVRNGDVIRLDDVID